MELIYKGKNAIVTGASGGIGLEVSKMLSENNINVLMLDIQNPKKSFLTLKQLVPCRLIKYRPSVVSLKL